MVSQTIKNKIKFILIISFVFLFYGYCKAETGLVLSLDKSEAYIGDIINLKVKAEIPKDAYITVDQGTSFKEFDILDSDIKHISANPNLYEINYKIAAYTTGKLNIEPVSIIYTNADGSEDILVSDSKSVQILSTVKDSDNDIKDIKPLSKLKIKPLFLILAILIIVAAFIILLFILKDISQKKEELEQIEIDPKTEALNVLEKLFQNEYMKENNIKLFYYRMFEVLRIYILKKLNIDTLGMTTEEFFQTMKGMLPEGININEFKSYLKIFNLARYAGFHPEKKVINESYEFTKDLLEKL